MNKNRLRKLISQNNLEKAIDSLLTLPSLIESNDYFNEIIMIKARFEKYQKEIRIGTISKTEADKTFNVINKTLLNYVDSLPGELLDDERSNVNKSVEIVLDGRVEEFSAEKKDDLRKMLSVMLKVPEEEVQINRIKQRSEDTLSLTIETINLEKLLKILNSNNPQIERIKNQFNIKSVQRAKEIAIWGLKKSVRYIAIAVVLAFVGIAVLSVIVYFILSYLKVV